MTVYSTSLPSMHLTGEDLESLEKLLRKDSSNEDFEFTFEKDGFSYTLDSVNGFINDADLPNKSTNYQFRLDSDEGEIYLNANVGNKLRISGNQDWVHKKKRQIEKQINSNKRILRTHASQIAVAVYILQTITAVIGIFISSNIQNTELNLSLFEGFIVSIAFLAFLTWPYLLISVGNTVFPYQLIKKDETIKYRPRIRKLGKFTFVLLSVIGGVAGLITIVQFI